MPKLRCDAEKCQHNLQCYCTRNKIEVGEIKENSVKAICKDYITGDSVFKNELAKDTFLDSPFAKNVKIECYTMDCKYNIDKICCTKTVSIEDGKTICDCAYCSTYTKRNT